MCVCVRVRVRVYVHMYHTIHDVMLCGEDMAYRDRDTHIERQTRMGYVHMYHTIRDAALD